MKERRREIEGFPHYQVSSNGYIISKHTGKPLTPAPDGSGYMTVCMCEEGKQYSKRVHKLVAEAFLKQPSEEAWQVNHRNGNKRDNSLSNLEYSTPRDNMLHAYANGLNHWEGYNETPIRVIETGKVYKSQAECARAIGGNQPNINACLMGRRNKHLGFHFEYVQ